MHGRLGGGVRVLSLDPLGPLQLEGPQLLVDAVQSLGLGQGDVGAELTSLQCCGGPGGSAAEYENPQHRSTVRRSTRQEHQP